MVVKVVTVEVIVDEVNVYKCECAVEKSGDDDWMCEPIRFLKISSTS